MLRSPLRMHSHMCRIGRLNLNLPRRASAPRVGLIAQQGAARASSSSSSGAAKSATEAVATKAKGPVSPFKEWTGIYMELSKARLSALVVATTSAGFLFAGGPVDWPAFAAVTVGTSLAACSANTFNQAIEKQYDSLMVRTKRRPLPTGRISQRHAFAFGIATGLVSTAILAAFTNNTTAALGAANILLYAGVYTPMKRMHILNTWVGAVVGAIPPVMGWTAAGGNIISPEAALLGTTLFLWQFPHFFSLAWLGKEDYTRGSYKMIPVLDKTGRATAKVMLRYAAYMMPVGFAGDPPPPI